MRIINSLIDKYLASPILCDAIIAGLVWVASKHFALVNFALTDKSNQINLMTNLIGADVSLAGFILAALTIIVTFKSNVQSKGMNDAMNALELIFSSKHYYRIVQVFKKSLIEFVMCFILLFCAWLSTDNFLIETVYRINVTGIILTTLSISRSLFVLFMILDLEKHKRIDD